MKYRLALILPAYVVVFAACYFVAYVLRFDFALTRDVQTLLLGTVTAYVGIKMIACHITGEWQRSYRYATLPDVLLVLNTAVAGSALAFAANHYELFGPIPRSVILIDCALSIPALGMVRIGARFYAEMIRTRFSAPADTSRQRALVFGTDREAVEIVRAAQLADCGYQVVGLIDDHANYSRTLIAGVPTYPLRRGWEKLASKLAADLVLIPGSLPGRRVREIVEESRRAGLKTQIIPSVQELVGGRYKLSVRDVTISDLLRREPARLDLELIRRCIENRRILVTGAAGSIGSELCRQILRLKPARLVLLDQSELAMFHMTQELSGTTSSRNVNASAAKGGVPVSAESGGKNEVVRYVVGDVADEASLRRHLQEHAPQTVFHAAAYKHVPLMEDNVREAVRNNVFGTKTLAELSAQAGVERFVFISTDKAVRPSSVMGATKLLAETFVQTVAERSSMCCMTVRFGNVLNSAGSVVPTFRRQIERGGPITVTHPRIERFFMTIPEAVQLVLQAAAVGRTGDLLVLEMGRPCRIVDLAKDMISLSGLKYPDDVDIVFTGLRPGEKLTEELFYPTEERAEKVHEKIFCAQRPAPSAEFVERQLAELQRGLNASDAECARRLWSAVERHLQLAEAAEPPLRKAA